MLESIKKYKSRYMTPEHYPWVADMVRDVEDEIADSYVLLPVDEDGVPIHVGDEVQGFGDSGPVQHVELWDDGWVVVFEFAPGQFTRYSGDAVRHYKPRTIEEVLRDAIGEYERAPMDDYDAVPRIAAKYAEEIRGMMA